MTKEVKNVSMQNNSTHIFTPHCESVEIRSRLNLNKTNSSCTIPFYKSGNSPKETFHINNKTKVVIENINGESNKVVSVNLNNNMVLYIPIDATYVFVNLISCFEKILLRSMTKKELISRIKEYNPNEIPSKQNISI